LRNLLTALAALVIVVAAGAAYYFGTKDEAAVGSSQAPGSSMLSQSTAAGTAATSPSTSAQSAQTEQPEIGPEEHVLGKADAPVTIIEYASMTCPHCADFHAKTMPRIKADYIDKGLVRFVFRPFPLDKLAARATLLAQCAPGDGYFSMIDILFRSQNDWSRAPDQIAALKQIGRTVGLSDADMDRCMADEASVNKIVAGMQDAQARFGINSTPSFVVNGKTYTNRPMEDFEGEDGTMQPGFDKIIKDLLPKT
jgi:protein-disulfide isomerase